MHLNHHSAASFEAPDPAPDAASPRVIHVEPTTRCNMRCRMCVKTVCDGPEGDLPLATYRRLEGALGKASRLVFSGVGEPLLHPDLPEMIAFARAALPQGATIALQSNGLLLAGAPGLESGGPDLASSLLRAGLDEICISLDSLDSGHGESLHGAASLDRLERAFAALASASASAGRALRVGVEIVLMRSTLESLPELLRWAGRRGASFAIVSHVFSYTAEAAAESLFNPNPPEAQACFEKWRDLAATEDLDFFDYYRILWKVGKTPAQKRLVELVKLMQRDANAGGLWMNVKSLFDWQGRDTARLQEVLALARRVAGELGMELSLPPTSALHQRRCAFLEDGASFVSWTGHISPCHFLWRSYRCLMDGEPKHVRAVSFGDLARESLEAVWDKEDYREFRGQALAYEYPYCSSCNGGPCSDITALGTSPFEEDCIGSNVPCCHCPWPVGQLACLG